MHLLPVLGALAERRRREPVVVIGVHSAKFDAEQAPARIAEAMSRYGVDHPVVVDEGHRVWQSYAVRSWPTLVVVRPDGTLAAVAPGEAELDPLDAFVGKVLDEARADGTLAAAPFARERAAEPSPGALAFPGKLIALLGGRMAVADSGHNRVLIVDPEGRVEDVIGSGAPGLADGAFGDARLRRPQGLAFDRDLGRLFVADAGNHAIREADLDRRRVRTIAGTGELGRAIPVGRVAAREIGLRSPWDLTLAGDWLLVAMAGAHQVWAYSPVDETIGVLAGSGRESIADGPFVEAAFAQPSGLALAGSRLYVADSETSAVRYLDLTAGEVHTLVGTGLFDFGDADGPARSARLQHPIGISHGPAGLLVADSYNDKIKAVDEATGAVRTFFAAADRLALREPAGLCQLPDGRVVVADTNQHRLVVLGADGASAAVLPVGGVAVDAAASQQAPGPRPTLLRAVTLGRGDATLRLRLEPHAGYALAEGSRVSIRLSASGPFAAPADDQGFMAGGGRRGVPVRLALRPGAEASTSEGAIDVSVEAALCSTGDAAACWPVGATFRIPVRAAAGAPAAADATLALADPAG